jgi:AcrR family transcriptional regulator
VGERVMTGSFRRESCLSLRDTVFSARACRHYTRQPYHWWVPRLWNETIESHRRAVQDAILDTTWALVSEHGLLSVTMSQIAQETGIGRATLYKYFPDVESILLAHHERHVAEHLTKLTRLREQPGRPRERLEALLLEYARILYHRGQSRADELMTLVHQDAHAIKAQDQVRRLIRGAIADAAKAGDLRQDVPADELTQYCVHALSAASGMPSEKAVRRLVAITLTGLIPS